MRPKFQAYAIKSGQGLNELVEVYAAIVKRVEPATISPGVVRDPKDEMVLACAIGGKADCIVTGDQDLLTLQVYEGIPIWTVAHFLQVTSKPE